MKKTPQPHAEPRPWRLQYSLRTLLLFITALCIGLGCLCWFFRPFREYGEAARPFQETGARIYGDPVCGAEGITRISFRNPLTDEDLGRLKDDLHKQPYLRKLSFSDTTITDAGFVHISELAGLEELSLTGTPITNAGLLHLKGLIGLERLRLNDTQITDDGLEHLKTLTALKALCLSDTQITDAGLVHLKEFTNLDELDLSSTRVTGRGFESLEPLPKLRVLYLFHSELNRLRRDFSPPPSFVWGQGWT